MADEFSINPPNAPIGRVDGANVIIDRSWYRYFSQVQAVTGGGLIASLRDAEYLTYSPSLVLPNARRFVGGTALTLVLTSDEATLNLDDTGVAPATYGSATAVGSFTVDAQGRLIFASSVPIDPAAIGAVTSVDASGGTTGLLFSGGPITGAGTLTLSGTLDEANGGTGFSSYIAGDLIYAASASALARLGIGLANHVLTSNGTAPGWTANTGTGNVVRATRPQITDTLGVGTAASASGSGISFPATQSASTDPNTLDDYEEGTWAPTVTAVSGVLTSYTSSGTYTKIGRLVIASAKVTITNNGTGSVALRATLPFANNATFDHYGSGRENGIMFVHLLVEAPLAQNYALVARYDGAYPGGTGSEQKFTIAYTV